MINLNLENNPILYKDYEEGLKFLANVKDEDYEYPNDIGFYRGESSI